MEERTAKPKKKKNLSTSIEITKYESIEKFRYRQLMLINTGEKETCQRQNVSSRCKCENVNCYRTYIKQ